MTPLLEALSESWINNGVLSRWFDTPTDPFQAQGTPGSPGAYPLGEGGGATITTTVVAGVVTAVAIANVAGGTNYAVGDILTVSVTSPGVLLLVTSVGTGADAGKLDTTHGSVIVIAGGAVCVAAIASATVDYSYSNPDGDGQVAGTRSPLDTNVVIQKCTEIRGKSWKGTWRPCPIGAVQQDSAVGDMDQLSPAAQLLWKIFAYSTYLPITDGESILYPLLVSVTESQVIRTPTLVAYAPLVLPGLNSKTGVFNPIVDIAFGSSSPSQGAEDDCRVISSTWLPWRFTPWPPGALS